MLRSFNAHKSGGSAAAGSKSIPDCDEDLITPRNRERFVGRQIRRFTPQWCLADSYSWIQQHGEVSHI